MCPACPPTPVLLAPTPLVLCRRRAEPEGKPAAGGEEEVPFGYKNKDPYILGAGLIGLGFAMYYGLQVRAGRGRGRVG